MPKTGYPFVQSAFTLFVLSAQRFDVKRTMAYVSWAAKASAVPIRQYIDHRYNERVTGLTRVGNMIRVKGAVSRSLLFILAAAQEKTIYRCNKYTFLPL
jgi:hypothetical protein